MKRQVLHSLQWFFFPLNDLVCELAFMDFYCSGQYFHTDHMSSAEKQKLELKNVREKFKISESDCGSARVQGTENINITFFLHSQCYFLS